MGFNNTMPIVQILIQGFIMGGAERVMIDVANGLNALGRYKVEIVTFNENGPTRKLLDPSIPIKRLHFSPSAIRFKDQINELSNFFSSSAGDVFISYQLGGVDTAIKRSVGSGIKYIETIHNNLYTSRLSPHLSLRGRFKAFLYSIYKMITATQPDMVVAVSECLRDEIVRHGERSGRTRVIYNPVICDRQREMIKEDAYHPWFDDVERRPVIINVGRLEIVQKRQDLLIRAFALLREKIDARLMIIGNDFGDRAAIEKLIDDLDLRDHVELLGMKENPLPYVKKADLFAFSSDYEGFGVVVAEALFCGTPVVSTDCPYGPREILQDGRYGRLVPVGDVHALAKAMIESLSEHHTEEERAALRARAEDFSEKASIDAWSQAIDDLLS